jgi:hypothetical protein
MPWRRQRRDSRCCREQGLRQGVSTRFIIVVGCIVPVAVFGCIVPAFRKSEKEGGEVFLNLQGCLFWLSCSCECNVEKIGTSKDKEQLYRQGQHFPASVTNSTLIFSRGQHLRVSFINLTLIF